MTIAIRAAQLEADGDRMIKLLAEHLNPAYDRARFDWLYRANPDGEARAWLAVDTATDDIVGTAAAVPRRVYVEGAERLAWVLSDFCIAHAYRALGPALRLQRACLAPVASGEVPLAYDFPSASMVAIYTRMGVSPVGHLRRLAWPLRVDARVRERVKAPTVARGIAAAGNLLLSFTAPRRTASARDGIEVSLHPGECGPEFSALARALGPRHRFCVRRSAEYMNWRFLANPFQRHEIVTLREAGELTAYAVLTVGGEAPTMVDLFGPPDGAAVVSLVADTVALLRARGASGVSLSLLEPHPWIPPLRKLGFRRREALPAFAYGPAIQDAPAGWLLTQGDRDS